MKLAVDARVVRAFAALDLVPTALLALPPLAERFVALLYALEARTGGAGAPPEFAPLHWLFACLAGALGVLWAGVRLAAPSAGLALADALGRAWVAGLLVWFVLARGAPRVLLAFVATELAGALAQLVSLRRASARLVPAEAAGTPRDAWQTSGDARRSPPR